MSKFGFLLTCQAALIIQVASQCARQQRNELPYLSTIIAEPPCNSIVPITAPSSTIVITDCSPSACKNMADTLNLMIVCNLLQNTQGGQEMALKLARPVINELISSPSLSCGCQNPKCPNALPDLFPSQLANALTKNFASVLPNQGFNAVANYAPLNAGAVCANAGANYPNAGAIYPNAGAIYPNAGAVYANAGAICPNAVNYAPPCNNVVNPNLIPSSCACMNGLLNNFLSYL